MYLSDDFSSSSLQKAADADAANATNYVAVLESNNTATLIADTELPRVLRSLGSSTPGSHFDETPPDCVSCLRAYVHPLHGLRYITTCRYVPSAVAADPLSNAAPTSAAKRYPRGSAPASNLPTDFRAASFASIATSASLPSAEPQQQQLLNQTVGSSTARSSSRNAWASTRRVDTPRLNADKPAGSAASRPPVFVLSTEARKFTDRYQVAPELASLYLYPFDIRDKAAHSSTAAASDDLTTARTIGDLQQSQRARSGLRVSDPTADGAASAFAGGASGVVCVSRALVRQCERATLSIVEHLAKTHSIALTELRCEFVQDFSQRIVLNSILDVQFLIPDAPAAPTTARANTVVSGADDFGSSVSSPRNGGFASPVAVPKRVNSPGPSQHGEKIINKIKRAQVSLRAGATKC